MATPAVHGRRSSGYAPKARSALYRPSTIFGISAVIASLYIFLSGRPGLHLASAKPSFVFSCLILASFAWLITSIVYATVTHPGSIPGPRLAKATTAWKAFHVLAGTYRYRLQKLHCKYGGLVQVAPNEFSITKVSHIQRCELVKISSPLSFIRNVISTETLATIGDRLQMASIFGYEERIQRCNDALLQTLTEYEQSGETVNVADVVARYAYDTVFVTSAGVPAGFLQRRLDVTAIKGAMERWKFNAILCGTYFRFHPFITKLICRLQPRNLESMIARHLKSIAPDRAEGGCDVTSKSTLEATVALMVAGADPAVTHILSSLFYIYRDARLLDQVRDEIRAAELSQFPTIKELLYAAPRMPLLHAILLESLRLHLPGSGRYKYVVPRGGRNIDYKYLAEGCKICVEPSLVHVNPVIFGTDPDSFQLHRWLSNGDTPVRAHMLAFGANDRHPCPGQNLHISVVSKLLVQVISNFDIDFKINMSSGATITSPSSSVAMTYEQIKACTMAGRILPADLKVTTTPDGAPLGITTASGNAVINNKGTAPANNGKAPISPVISANSSSDASITPLTWSDECRLEDTIGRQKTNELLRHFDPCKVLRPGAPFQTSALSNPKDRAIVHEVIESVWQGRLAHATDSGDQRMWVWVPGSKVPWSLQRLYNRNQAKDKLVKKREPNTTAPAKVVSTAPASKVTAAAPARNAVPVNPVWGNFAAAEKAEHNHKSTMAYYVAMRAEEARNPMPETQNTVVYNEKFVARVVPKVEEPEVKKVIIPPHMRKALAEAAVPKQTEAANAVTHTNWVAARLPNPCAN